MDNFEKRLQNLQETHLAERNVLEENASMCARRAEEATAAADTAVTAAAAVAADEASAATALVKTKAAEVTEVREALRAAEAKAEAAAAEVSAQKEGAEYLKDRLKAIPEELRAAFEAELGEREGAVREKVRDEVRTRGGGAGLSFVAFLSHLTIDHASFSRRSTVPTPSRDTSNVWALITLLPYIK